MIHRPRPFAQLPPVPPIAALPGVAALLACLLVATPSVAQRSSSSPADAPPPIPLRVVSAGGDPDTPDLTLDRATSLFNLAAAGDVAHTGMRMSGSFMWCTSNRGPGDGNYNPCYFGYQLLHGAWRHGFFDVSLIAAAPAGAWERYRDSVPELREIRNPDGHSAPLNAQLLTGRISFDAADGSLGELFSGARSTADGSCRDFTEVSAGLLAAGTTLLASSGCPDTWPASGWGGSPAAGADLWREHHQSLGHAFGFDWWRLAEAPGPRLPIGDFQTHGRISDHASTVRPLYGRALPGGAGEPGSDGYPLGLVFEFDAFTFAAPDLANAVLWRATVVNRSEDVYGVGFDYDSLYLGLLPQPSTNISATATYHEPHTGAVRWVNNGVHPDCNGARVPQGVDACFTHSQRGFYWGAQQLVVLASPIGDLRNKLFSDPTSEFYDPAHPRAGDTITFNHARICGYGGCAASTILTDRARRAFGMISSREEAVLDGRHPHALSTTVYYRTFRNADWPERSGFNRYVPGDWRYSNRPPGSPQGPDTLYLDSCLGSGDPRHACATTWSDTLPGGLNNRYGNVQVLGMGPFPLAAGDTTRLAFAITSAPDSAGIEAQLQAVTDAYLRFWPRRRTPEAPPVLASTVRGGAADSARVTLYIGTDGFRHSDPFFADLRERLLAAPDSSALGRVRAANPGLANNLASRATNDLAQLRIYRSCDDGGSWTAAGESCRGSPLIGPHGHALEAGWRPVAVFERGTSPFAADFPAVWTDHDVRPGVTYTYAVVAVTAPARWLVSDPQAPAGARQLDFGPALFSELSSEVERASVVRVYVPASRRPGALAARVEIPAADQRGPARIPYAPVEVDLLGEPVEAAAYRIVFADSFRIRSEGGSEQVVAYRGPESDTHHAPTDRSVVLHVNPSDTIRTEDGLLVRSGVGVVVVRESDGAALMVGTRLAGGLTVPPTIAASSGLPFILDIDRTHVGRLHDVLLRTARGDTVAVPPAAVGWDSTQVLNPAGAARERFSGEYRIVWHANPFGASGPLPRDGSLRSALIARAAPSRTRRDPDVLEALGPVVFGDLDADDLVEASLPFEIENLTHGRTVRVAMLRRARHLPPSAAGSADSLDFGPLGDPVRIEVPGDVWVPGDYLYFIETIDGQTTVTWRGRMLACGVPRRTCDPFSDDGLWSEPGIGAGSTTLVRYHAPFTSESEFRVVVTPAGEGPDAPVAADDPEVLVVPNPYVFEASFRPDRPEGALYFTNLPARGVLRIYSISGAFVQEIRWEESDLTRTDGAVHASTRASGDLRWDLRTREGRTVSSGLYVFTVEGERKRRAGKFVVIR